MRNIFITGGIGDVLAIEACLTDEVRESIETVYYATVKHGAITSLLNSFPSFKNIKNHVVLWNEFEEFPCFFHLREFRVHCALHGISFDIDFDNIEDYSILRMFKLIHNHEYKYTYSSALKYDLGTINHILLPSKFITLCPTSDMFLSSYRSLSLEDIDRMTPSCNNYVLLNGTKFEFEKDNVINLSGETSITESIEIMKRSEGYIGIDSFMSVLATKFFATSNIAIRQSIGPMLQFFPHVYYAPHKEFPFMNLDIFKCEYLMEKV